MRVPRLYLTIQLSPANELQWHIFLQAGDLGLYLAVPYRISDRPSYFLAHYHLGNARISSLAGQSRT